MKRIYTHLALAIVFTLFSTLSGIAQNAWINEFHYNDFGTDTNEFIEVVIQGSGSFSLADFSVVLYNGNNGASYDTRTLDQFTPAYTFEGYVFYYFMYPVNGIQNGEPDGMALVYNDVVLEGQFLSYEGVFSATDGPASGMTSVDIGVLESGEEEGLSLQLSGQGSAYLNFTWQAPADETHGELNNAQDLLPVGIEVPNELNFTLYPNPNPGKFTLINPVKESAQLTVYSNTGQKLSVCALESGENKISLDLARGIYYLVLSTTENTLLETKRIIIN
jgi:hypothetical protein